MRELLGTPGVPTLMIASVITVTAQDLIIIYLPLLGAQRGIDVAHVGALLMVRSVTRGGSRVFYPTDDAGGRPGAADGRHDAGRGAAASSSSPCRCRCRCCTWRWRPRRSALGIAATLSISNMVDIVPPGARGVALSLRITGNRVGQVTFPVAAGLVAAAMGAGGIFAIMALSLVASAASVQVVRGGGRQ